MNGVEILVTEQVAIAYEPFNWTTFWVTLGVCFVIGLVAGVIFGLNERDFIAGLVMFLCMFIVGGSIVSILLGAVTGKPTEYTEQYKVTVDESVSMTEFMEKYEIVEQEGKIFVVRERDQIKEN